MYSITTQGTHKMYNSNTNDVVIEIQMILYTYKERKNNIFSWA